MTGDLAIAIVSVSATLGGAEHHTVALAGELAARGHRVTLYGECPGWPDGRLARQPLPIGPKWSKRTIVPGLLRVPRERPVIGAIPPASVYHLQFKREQIAFTEILSRTAPVVWTEHGRFLGGLMGRALLRAYRRAAGHVAKIICVSPAVAEDLARVVDPEKLLVIPNSIDTNRFVAPPDDERKALRQALLPTHFQDRTVAILAARLHPAKRHDRAIEAALASGCSLVVVGDGPDRGRLERIAAGDPDVVFLGHRADVASLLGASDLYLYCGAPTDGMPTVVLEAAACGLPVVGFAGDPGVELIAECGGSVIAAPRALTTETVAALVRRRGAGVEYVADQHGRRAWSDAYEAAFRGVVSA